MTVADHGMRGGQGRDQRIPRIGERPGKQVDFIAGHAEAGDAAQHAGIAVDRQAHRALDAGVAAEPLEARLCAGGA